MALEYRLFQSFRVNGTAIPLNNIQRAQWLEGCDLLLPAVLFDFDDPSGDLASALLTGEQALLEVEMQLDRQRERAAGERSTIRGDFHPLRCVRLKDRNAGYSVLALASGLLPLLRRKELILPQTSLGEILTSITPAFPLQSEVLLPLLDFHCLWERPCVPVAQWLRKQGLQIAAFDQTWKALDLGSTSTDPVKRTYYPPDVSIPHPLLECRTMPADWLTTQLQDRQAFHVDFIEGPTQYDKPPDFEPSKDAGEAQRSHRSIRPLADFLTSASLEIRPLDPIRIEPRGETPLEGFVWRTSWLDTGTRAMQRILLGERLQ